MLAGGRGIGGVTAARRGLAATARSGEVEEEAVGVLYAVPRHGPRVVVTYFPDMLKHRSPEDALRAEQRPRRPADAPQHVQDAAAAAIHALGVFHRAGFKDPFQWEQGPIQIVLENVLPFRGFTAPTDDLIRVERTLRGREQAETIAHEIFHRVQYAYNRTSVADDFVPHGPLVEVTRFLPMLREGGARMAEIMAYPGSQRYEHDAQDWFLGRVSALVQNQRGRRRGFAGASYQAGLFWKYVAEQHGTSATRRSPVVGHREAQTQLFLLRAIAAPDPGTAYPPTIEMLRAARREMRRDEGDFDRFRYLPGVPDVPVSSATTWGDFQVALMLNGTAGADTRFRFEEAQRWRGTTAGRPQIPADRSIAFDSLPSEIPEEAARLTTAPWFLTSSNPTRDTLADSPASHLGAGRFGPEMLLNEQLEQDEMDRWLNLRDQPQPSSPGRSQRDARQTERAATRLPPRMLEPFSMMAFRVTIPAGAQTRLMRVRWQPLEGLTDAMLQVVSLDEAGELQDLFRHDGASSRPLDRVFGFRGVREVLLIVGSRTAPGNFELRLSQAADQPVLMAASCNGRSGRFLTRDPNRAAFDWMSPDIEYAGTDGQQWDVVEVFLVNRGTVEARGLEVTARCAPAANLPARLADWTSLMAREGGPDFLATEDACARIETLTPARRAPRPPPPCRFSDDAVATPDDDGPDQTFVFGFNLPRGQLGRMAIRVEAKARGTGDTPLVIYGIFNGRGPTSFLT